MCCMALQNAHGMHVVDLTLFPLIEITENLHYKKLRNKSQKVEFILYI